MTENTIEGGVAVIGTSLAWFFGGFDGIIKMLVALSIIDYVTGVMKAYEAHELSSEIGFKGIAKKVMIFLLAGTANVIDNEMLGGTEILRDAVCFFYIANEGVSILENAVALGLPVPEFMKEKLRGIAEKASEGRG